MNPYAKTAIAMTALMMAFLFCQTDSHAQASLANLGKDSKRSGKQGPTTITSDSMDIDIANNIATFIGKVEVDDSDMNIKCHKMIIFLEDAKKDASKPEKKPEDGESEFGNKEVTKVECIGDVVIVRKVKDASGKLDLSQKALAGKATYEINEGGRITLEEDPVIIRKDKDMITGEKIIIYRDSERMQVFGGGKIRTSSEDDSSKKADGASDNKKPDNPTSTTN